MLAFGFKLGEREPPVESAGRGLAVPRQSGPVDEFRENGVGAVAVEDGDGGDVVHERGARFDTLREAYAGFLHLCRQVGAVVGVLPASQPVLRHVGPPRAAVDAAGAHLGQLRVMAPDDIGVKVLDAGEEVLAAVLLCDGGDAGEGRILLEPARPPREVEVDAAVGVEAREEALPAVRNLVELL